MTAATAELLGADLAEDLAATALTLARRYQDGATLWVISPEWEPHAHHVAVEFVHPVIMGKRALPAFALTSSDPAGETRLAARPGDVVLVVSRAEDPKALDVLRRTPAWGTTSIWLGFGARPAPGAADHVLWVDSDDPMLPSTGGFVLMYHLLWELTHVCFEHPGLLTVAEEPECTDEVCVTCKDEGRLGEVISSPFDAFGPALVRTAEGEEDVDMTLVGEVAPGDLVMVHAGMAIARLDRS